VVFVGSAVLAISAGARVPLRKDESVGSKYIAAMLRAALHGFAEEAQGSDVGFIFKRLHY
jgi:hypothetical protein